jgi:nucleoside-diphosphate-sugar epimerase
MFIVVTGCAGFIGSHLCERLLDAGHEIMGLDALTNNYDRRLKLRNLSRAMDSARFHFVETTISGAGDHLFQEAEVIFHLAAQPGVSTSWGCEFDTYVTNNILDTQILLERASGSRNLKRLVYASSSSVYGNIASEKVDEDHPTHPYSPYGVTKLAAEHLCSVYGDVHGLPVAMLRLFSVCGPRQRPDMMFHKLIHAALTGARFTIYGDGRMERDFTPVMDVVDAFMLASETSVAQGVFNIANGTTVSVSQAVALVQEACGTRIALEYRGQRYGDVLRTSADISKARTLLKYQPKWTLQDAVRLHVPYVEQSLSVAQSASNGAGGGANAASRP